MISINATTRQFTIPGTDLVFGVEADSGTERKHFQCPRYVGDGLDVAACFVRINYRNASGETDSYLVDDLVVDGTSIKFSWLLHPKVTAYRGQVKFVMCLVGPDLKLKWHTTLGTGQVNEGLEPDNSHVEGETADVVAALIAMVTAQTAAVESVGEAQRALIRSAAETASDNAVAEIEAKRANSLASIPNDYTALSNSVEKLARSATPGIICDAAGEAITLSDASDNYVSGLRIFGKSTQSGIPTPDNPVEIVSVENPVVMVGGRNLIPPTKEAATAQGITSTPVTGSGTIILNGTAAQEISRIVSQNFLLNPGKYTLSAKDLHIVDGNKDRLYLNAADNSGTIVNYVMSNKPVTFEITKSILARAAFVIAAGSTYNNEVVSAQLELGDTATAYEPYKPAQTIEITHPLRGIPVTSGGNYTDSNGQQWICDEVDLERGVYVQRVHTENITRVESLNNAVDWTTDKSQFTGSLSVKGAVGRRCLLTHGASGIWFNNADLYCGIGYPTLFVIGGNRSKFGDTVASCNEYLSRLNAVSPVNMTYAMENPIETPLTETELAAYRSLRTYKPNTTILNDSGTHMTVEYTADTKLYIDNKIKEVK